MVRAFLLFLALAALESAAATLTVVEGNDQRVVAGAALGPIRLRLVDDGGQPVADAALAYSHEPVGSPPSLQGGGRLIQTTRTDMGGFAAIFPGSASTGVGAQEFEVTAMSVTAAAKVRYTTTTAQGGTTVELGDLWWGGQAESGWGMSINQRGDRLFNVWFLYDDAGDPTWIVQPGGTWSGGVGGMHKGGIYWPRGTPWYAYDAS